MSQKFYSEVTLETLNNATTDTDRFLVGDSGTIKYRTGSQLLSDLGVSGLYVPYTGATGNVDLGTHTLSSYNLIVNHTSGSGVAASITKGGSGEALTINKTSGSGNAMSVTGGLTSLVNLTLSSIANATIDTDRFIVSDGGAIKYRTGAEVLSDIGGQAALTNPITGTGTTNYVSKFTGATTLGNSLIYDNGTNVGIGTTSPGAKLDVYGDTFGRGVIFGLIPNTSTQYAGFTYGVNSSVDGFLFLKNGGGNVVGISAAGNSYFNGGNVGIGTTNPTFAKLKVSGASASGAIISEDTSGTTSFVRILGDISSQNLINWQSGTALRFATSTQDYASFSEAMRITSSGNVGIGTTSPDYPLEIENTNQTSIVYQRTGVSAKKWGFISDNGATYWSNITDNTLPLTLQNGGNVGIGTLSPSAGLQINRSSWGLGGSNVSRMLQKSVGIAGDYEQHVILLHPIYNGTLIDYNKCSGTIYASRGGTGMGLINDTYDIDTASAYSSYNGTVNSTIGYGRLYTCDYNGVKYIALLPDYRTSAVEYDFDGYIKSTGEELKVVVYRLSNSGTIINSEVNSSLTLFSAGITYYQGNVYTAGSFVGNLSGTADQTSVTFSNSGATFESFFNSQAWLTDKNYLIYNTSDAPRGGLGLYTVAMNNWDAAYGSMFAIDCEPGQGIGYIKTKYGGSFGAWKMLIDNASNQTIGGNKNFTNNLGIGTTNPTEILHLQSNQPVIRYTKTGVLNWKVGIISGNNFTINTDSGGGDAFNINTIGNVGIGTTSPTFVTTGTTVLDINGSTGAAIYLRANIAQGSYLRQTSNNLVIGNNTYGDIIYNTGFTEAMRITADRLVGIGTTSPNSLLQVGSSNFVITDRTSAVYGPESQTIFTVGRSGVDYPQLLNFGVNQAGLYSSISARQFTVSTENNLVLQPSGGNVGIGTTSPGSKLSLFDTSDLWINISKGSSFVNIGVDATGTFYNTNSNHRFLYNSGSNEALRITSSGNVGIGTTSPANLLEVYSTAGVSDLTALRLTNGTGAVGANVEIFLSAAGNNGGVRLRGEAPGSNHNNFGVYVTNAGTLQNTPAIFAQGSTNNVGIGTTSPSSLLHLSKNAELNITLSNTLVSQSSNYGVDGNGAYLISSANTVFYNGGVNERMRITSAGNVGIGTTSPNNSAILHLRSTTQGFLPPVMRTGERNGISSPAIGLMIFNEEEDAVQVYTGEGWRTLAWA